MIRSLALVTLALVAACGGASSGPAGAENPSEPKISAGNTAPSTAEQVLEGAITSLEDNTVLQCDYRPDPKSTPTSRIRVPPNVALVPRR